MSAVQGLSSAVFLCCKAARLPVSEFFAAQIVQALAEGGFSVVETPDCRCSVLHMCGPVVDVPGMFDYDPETDGRASSSQGGAA